MRICKNEMNSGYVLVEFLRVMNLSNECSGVCYTGVMCYKLRGVGRMIVLIKFEALEMTIGKFW